MHQIIVSVTNKKNMNSLKFLLKKFDFIERVEKKTEIPKSKFKSWDEFKEIFGIWKGRDITKESLRKKAWRQRTLFA